MNSENATQTLPTSAAAPNLRASTATVLIVLWALAAALSCSGLSWLETLHGAALLIGLALSAVFAASRLWTAGLAAFAFAALSPFFQRIGVERPFAEWDLLTRISAIAPFPIMLLLGLIDQPRIENTTHEESAPERLLEVRSVRWNLAATLALLAISGTVLSAQPASASAPRVVFLALFVLFALRPLLTISASASGARVLRLAICAALLAGLLSGGLRYANLRGHVREATELLQKDHADGALAASERAADLNQVLASRESYRDVEMQWALYRERKNDLEGALVHWRRIADDRRIETSELIPVQRILLKMGDSLKGWRSLIYQGFDALTPQEIAPGILALGERPDSDLRGRELAALLAWEQNAPVAERRKRLEAVRALSPKDVTANNLLRRLGDKTPNAMWLAGDLLVGKNMSVRSLAGELDELGEVDSVVVLNAGHWEVAMVARATPLLEEWPIVRVEFNGKEVARTQISRYENHEVPFSIDVRRGDIYRVKIIFENRQQEIDQGNMTRRGLTISGIHFRANE